ncbi:AAA family ATPase [Pseudalkalibacillus sp. A8]
MAKTITFGLQKGGVSKTTPAAITAFILAREGYKVLMRVQKTE